MDNHLNCEIIRDLLPSYVDGLTSDETNRAVEAHLENCADCSAALRRMKEPEQFPPKPDPEVDYLKKVRRHTKRTSVLVGIALMLVGMALLSYRYFYVGSEVRAAETACNVSVTGNTVSLRGALTVSGSGVSRVTFTESGGIVWVKIYTAPKAFFNSGAFRETYTAFGEVSQVRIDQQIVWENGVEIGRTAAQVFAVKNPYVGDMPADGAVAAALGIPDQFGSYKNELKTSAEPYGWSLLLNDAIGADEEAAAREIMTADSYVMLAVIGNLSDVTWKYTTEQGKQSYTVSAEEASAYAGRDIKQCAESATDLQALMQGLSIKWSGMREAVRTDSASPNPNR